MKLGKPGRSLEKLDEDQSVGRSHGDGEEETDQMRASHGASHWTCDQFICEREGMGEGGGGVRDES